MYDKLDLTQEKERDFDGLYRRIVEMVKDTQLFLVRPYPHILLVTHDQFNILRPGPDFEPQDDLLWKTIDPATKDIINVMDIHVKGVYEPKSNMVLLT